jgi:hypothetical protein
MQTCAPARACACVCVCARVRACVCVRRRVRRCARLCVHACMRVWARAPARVCGAPVGARHGMHDTGTRRGSRYRYREMATPRRERTHLGTPTPGRDFGRDTGTRRRRGARAHAPRERRDTGTSIAISGLESSHDCGTRQHQVAPAWHCCTICFPMASNSRTVWFVTQLFLGRKRNSRHVFGRFGDLGTSVTGTNCRVRMHTCTHARMRACKHAHMQNLHGCAHAHSQICTWTHARTHAHIHRRAHA